MNLKSSKKLAATFLLVVAIALIVTNCKKEGSSDGKNTINMWTIYAEASKDTNAIAFRYAMEKARTAFSDVEIVHDGMDAEAYKTKIKTAAAAAQMPDVFYSWGAGFIEPFVKGGSVAPLDTYLKDGTLERMKGGVNSNFTFNNKIYGLTYTQWVAVLYCNKELFDTYGLKLPTTFEELKAAVKVFKANNVIPISVGEKDRWPGIMWQNTLAIRTASVKECNNALNGKSSFNTPDFVRSATLLKELVDMGSFVKGAMGISYTESKALFLTGQAAMFYMGSWFAGDIMGKDSSVSDKVVVVPFPLINGGKGDSTEFEGGSIDGLCVSSKAKNKKIAAEIIKFITEQMAIYFEETGSGIPTWNVTTVKSTTEGNPITAQIKNLVKDSSGYVLAWDTYLSGAAADEHKNLVAEIFGGTITPEDFAEKMQEVNK